VSFKIITSQGLFQRSSLSSPKSIKCRKKEYSTNRIARKGSKRACKSLDIANRCIQKLFSLSLFIHKMPARTYVLENTIHLTASRANGWPSAQKIQACIAEAARWERESARVRSRLARFRGGQLRKGQARTSIRRRRSR